MPSFRTETDSLGDISVPSDALWGAATQRAMECSPVSGRSFPASFIKALSGVKRAAALANGELGLLEKKLSSAIVSAAEEVCQGGHFSQFPLDIFQTGSGTSTNMNANEVIASLANLKLGESLGDWNPVHPNDHVNRCQSSNDVMPSALHISAAVEIKRRLIPALEELFTALKTKSAEFDHILKIGRTHLMDALPVRLGQEFRGWAGQIKSSIERIGRALPALSELALGSTAVGTGFGAHPDFAAKACASLSLELDMDFKPAPNRFEALSSRGPCIELSGALKAAAVALARIADDIRLLASGPALGLGEIKLPAVQPGSSIMPGKVNPAIPEIVAQVATQVIADDLAVSLAAAAGHLELNTQLPVVAANILESIDILSNAAALFARRCVSGIEANEEACRRGIDRSLALATALVPKIGYSRAASIAKEAEARGMTIREVAIEKKIATEAEIDKLLDACAMTQGS
ncbi:MAG: class II fumarate hydratase [Pseudomonadota bacterium]